MAKAMMETMFKGWFTNAIASTFVVAVILAVIGGLCALLLRSHVADEQEDEAAAPGPAGGGAASRRRWPRPRSPRRTRSDPEATGGRGRPGRPSPILTTPARPSPRSAKEKSRPTANDSASQGYRQCV